MRLFINDGPYSRLKNVVNALGTPTLVTYKQSGSDVVACLFLFESRDYYVEAQLSVSDVSTSAFVTDFPNAIEAFVQSSD